MKKFYLALALLCAMVLTACTSVTKLEMAVAIADEECPMEIEDGLVVTEIRTEGSNVIYEVMCDEDEYFTVGDLKDTELRSIMKDAMIEIFTDGYDEDIEELRRLCKKAEYNIVYRFVGKYTDEEVDIKIRYYEI